MLNTAGILFRCRLAIIFSGLCLLLHPVGIANAETNEQADSYFMDGYIVQKLEFKPYEYSEEGTLGRQVTYQFTGRRAPESLVKYVRLWISRNMDIGEDFKEELILDSKNRFVYKVVDFRGVIVSSENFTESLYIDIQTSESEKIVNKGDYYDCMKDWGFSINADNEQNMHLYLSRDDTYNNAQASCSQKVRSNFEVKMVAKYGSNAENLKNIVGTVYEHYLEFFMELVLGDFEIHSESECFVVNGDHVIIPFPNPKLPRRTVSKPKCKSKVDPNKLDVEY